LSITDGDIIITDLFNQIINFVSYLVFAALLIYILMPSIKLDIPQLKALSKKEIATHSGIGVLWILAFGIVFNIISFMLYRIFDIIPETSMNQMMINRALKSSGAIFIILTAVFVGPIVEELVFRKSFFVLIKNPKIALTVSSVCFGLIHMTTEIIQGDILMVVINGIGYISGGLALGYIYMKENKNIFIPIIAHMAYNLLSIVLSILG
ncbi:MAG TPA: CPBP family intramembrane metalloprotease, partial [Acholeplasma sp.]|nr:CPBP family intramembrane metalloprotease [Acholeplasma sp.]